MSFILRILFSGLIAFVPSEDGTEVTVLLLNVDHGHHISDGTVLSQHKPIVVTRAGSCSGQCPTTDATIANYFFADQTPTVALQSLQAAMDGGAAWQLSGSDLSLLKGSTSAPNLPALVLRDDVRGTVNGQPQTIPTTSTEREDLSWIADLKQICPSCTLNEDVLGEDPPAGLVAARFTLRSGTVFTYSVARFGSDVTPVYFQRLDGQGSISSYSQAVATWIGADIEVSGSNIELVEEKFDNSTGRTMTLAPDSNGRIEMAVLNLPPFVPPASSASVVAPEVGKHFEAYYELAQTPPAREARLVPRAGAASGVPAYSEVDWESVHPQEELWSDLLNDLRLDRSRGVYERILCPPAHP